MKPKQGYIIPFEGKVIIGQGYNSNGSHQFHRVLSFDASYSLDFILDEGTEVLASRGGVVSKVKDDSDFNYSGEDPKRARIAAKQANYVEIKHGDGTFTKYTHLKKDSVLVEVDQRVSQREPIAESGNTGWSSEAHLDFIAYTKNDLGLLIRTFPTIFSDYDGLVEDREINPGCYEVD